MPQWNGLCGADAGTTDGAICGVVVLAWPFEASKSSWSVCVRVPTHVPSALLAVVRRAQMRVG